jgi:hypothetical protein
MAGPTTRDPGARFGEVVAHRELILTVDGKACPVDVWFGKPFKSRGVWACRLKITGLPSFKTFPSPIYGADSVQALMLALELVGSILANSPEARRGELRWHEPPPFGFPFRVTAVGDWPVARKRPRPRTRS